MPDDPMTMERLGDIENRLDEAWGDPELMEGLAGDHIRDLCTALREAREREAAIGTKRAAAVSLVVKMLNAKGLKEQAEVYALMEEWNDA